MRILFVSHTDPFGPFRVGSHHLARALSRAGHEIVHLSTPLSRAHLVTGRVSRAAAARTPRDIIGDGGVRYVVPRTLLPAGIGGFRVAREVRRRGLGRFDVAFVDQPLMWSRSLGQIAERIVYRPTDEYPHGLKARLQRDILCHADGLVATSEEVLHRLGPTRLPSLVLENGVDAERFRSADGERRAPVAIYVGALDPRFDWRQVTAWAAEFTQWRFVLAGPATDAPARLPKNVELVGAVRYDELPRLLATARIGLLPLSNDPLNRGRSPMKRYEYLASGLAVVSRRTPVIRADESIGVFTYDEGEGAADAFRAAERHPSPNLAGAREADTHSWATKQHRLTAFVRSLPDRRR